MTTFRQDVLTNKDYVPNIVVRLAGEYFSIYQPDSGLVIKPEFLGLVESIVINPISIDPRRVSTTIANDSFKLVDKNLVVTSLVRDTGEDIVGAAVDIWIGRIGVSMDFADYLQLPTTKVKRYSHPDNSYTFSTVGDSDRINKPIYESQVTRLDGDIFPDTSEIAVKDATDLFPSAGTFVIDNEFISYTSKNDTTKRFSGITRGVFTTTPIAHSDDASVGLANVAIANPLTIILQLLTSGGGGSSYDVLSDGCAIDQSLIDITAIEALRDAYFSGVSYHLALTNDLIGGNALSFIEDQLLAPNNLRFTYSENSKLSLALLNKPIFPSVVIDEDTITKYPTTESDGNKIVNNLQISWDWDEDAGIFNQIQTFQDAASIAAYGLTSQISLNWYGVKASLDGASLVSDFADNYFSRIATPNPEISLNVQLDKSLANVGDKAQLISSQVPASDGTLKFNSMLEIVSRSINWSTGDVLLKLSFTSFTGIRSCFLAPSDIFASVTDQKNVGLSSGRGAYWEAGWCVRLWNDLTSDYESDSVNYISAISSDAITFLNNWSTTLTTHHRLKFCDYNDAVDSQKAYCFISPQGLDFAPSEKSYKITP
jgi:hypothetical protein